MVKILFWQAVVLTFCGMLILASCGAWGHTLNPDECGVMAAVPAFAAQDRNRGITREAALERHVKSIAECMNETPETCAFKDKEDVLTAIGLIKQVYDHQMPPGGKLDPNIPFQSIYHQCVEVWRESKAKPLPEGIHKSGPQIEG